jgi:hypothetical protein
MKREWQLYLLPLSWKRCGEISKFAYIYALKRVNILFGTEEVLGAIDHWNRTKQVGANEWAAMCRPIPCTLVLIGRSVAKLAGRPLHKHVCLFVCRAQAPQSGHISVPANERFKWPPAICHTSALPFPRRAAILLCPDGFLHRQLLPVAGGDW